MCLSESSDRSSQTWFCRSEPVDRIATDELRDLIDLDITVHFHQRVAELRPSANVYRRGRSKYRSSDARQHGTENTTAHQLQDFIDDRLCTFGKNIETIQRLGSSVVRGRYKDHLGYSSMRYLNQVSGRHLSIASRAGKDLGHLGREKL
jgi:hypothetical protein